ncbi:MAG: methyltransferase [Anaerofustis sp.]
MIRHIPFEQKELEIIEELPSFFGPNFPGTKLRNTPIAWRENVISMFSEKHPYWMSVPSDQAMMVHDLYNNTLGRGWGKDMTDVFGLEWEWVESAGGSIVRPGTGVLLENVNEWKEKVKIPNIDEWDWERAAKTTQIDRRLFTVMSFVNGFWFERLVSFMEFAPAAMALLDEEQVPAIHELFQTTTELGMKLVDKFCEYWPSIDGFNIHDDWGSQQAPFFSQEVADEIFLPYMKMLCDHIHSKGRYATLHSCGHTEGRIETIIAAGFDAWDPQPMNDTQKLWEKYGDKIVISVIPDAYDPSTTSEEDQRKLARQFADRFCVPGKPAQIGFYATPFLTSAFEEELYKASRQFYAERS